MKKNLVASLLIGLLIVGAMTIGVNALDSSKIPFPSRYISTSVKPSTVYPNSSQWMYLNGKWHLGSPDLVQGYADVWAYYEGKWYYIDNNGTMVQNEILRDNITQTYYYLSDDGSMMTNNYVYGWQGNLFYAKTDGSLTDSNGYIDSDTSTKIQTNATITIDQAKKIALDKVKAIKYPKSKVNVVIVPYFDVYEQIVDGRSGYIITIGEDNVEHTVPTERVFVDKSTGEVFDAFDVVFGTGNKKLKELK